MDVRRLAELKAKATHMQERLLQKKSEPQPAPCVALPAKRKASENLPPNNKKVTAVRDGHDPFSIDTLKQEEEIVKNTRGKSVSTAATPASTAETEQTPKTSRGKGANAPVAATPADICIRGAGLTEPEPVQKTSRGGLAPTPAATTIRCTRTSTGSTGVAKRKLQEVMTDPPKRPSTTKPRLFAIKVSLPPLAPHTLRQCDFTLPDADFQRLKIAKVKTGGPRKGATSPHDHGISELIPATKQPRSVKKVGPIQHISAKNFQLKHCIRLGKQQCTNVASIVFAPCDPIIAVASKKGVHIVHLESPPRRPGVHLEDFHSVAFLPCGGYMWVGGAQDGHACIAVADTREWEVHGATNLDVGVGEVSICAVDATRALCIVNHEAGARMVLATWQPDTHTVRISALQVPNTCAAVTSMACAGDMAVGVSGNHLLLWSLSSLELVKQVLVEPAVPGTALSVVSAHSAAHDNTWPLFVLLRVHGGCSSGPALVLVAIDGQGCVYEACQYRLPQDTVCKCVRLKSGLHASNETAPKACRCHLFLDIGLGSNYTQERWTPLSASSSPRYVACGAQGGAVLLWNIFTSAVVAILADHVHSGNVTATVFHRALPLFASLCDSGTLHIYEGV